MAININVKALRKALKITQQALADKLHIHQVTVARWETGKARPSNLAIRQLQRLARKCVNSDTGPGVHREDKLK